MCFIDLQDSMKFDEIWASNLIKNRIVQKQFCDINMNKKITSIRIKKKPSTKILHNSLQ